METQKTFPNGFTSWVETHHEIVAYITSVLAVDEYPCKVWQTKTSQGTGGIYELAEEWTDQFEKQYADEEWIELGYLETIEDFCDLKNFDNGNNV